MKNNRMILSRRVKPGVPPDKGDRVIDNVDLFRQKLQLQTKERKKK